MRRSAKIAFFAVFVLLCLPRGAKAQTHLINICLTSSGASAVSAQACTFTVAPHTAIVGFARLNGTTTFIGLGDSLGSTFGSGTTVTGVGATHGVFWTCDTGAVGGSDTVTITAAAAGQRFELDLLEYVGVPTSGCNDGESIITGTTPTNPIGSGPVTTTNANDLLVGFAGMNTLGTWTASTGYTIRTLDQVGEQMMAEDNLVSSTGTYATNPTFSVNGNWVGALVALKTQAASPCTPPGSDPYYVQSAAFGITNAYSLSTTLPCHSSSGHKVVVSISYVQSLGNHSETPIVFDSDGNGPGGFYTERGCSDGGAGNQTVCMYDATATTSNLLTITAAYTPLNDLKQVINVAVHEYKNLSAFATYNVCFTTGSLTCTTSTPFSTAANSFVVSFGGWQGLGSGGVVLSPPAGYVDRQDLDTVDGITTAEVAMNTADKYLAVAQGPNYSITVTSNTGGEGSLFTSFVVYGASAIRRKQGHVE